MASGIIGPKFVARTAAFVAAPILLLTTLSIAQDSKRGTDKRVPTAGKEYKNIKVLKDVPADQLVPIMREISRSLGVKCDYCHTINADHTGFERDDKHKKVVARQMIQMTMDINKKYKAVEGDVTCFMCHRGAEEPTRFPPASPETPGSVPDRPHSDSHEHPKPPSQR